MPGKRQEEQSVMDAAYFMRQFRITSLLQMAFAAGKVAWAKMFSSGM
jgi:hypothetical protein